MHCIFFWSNNVKFFYHSFVSLGIEPLVDILEKYGGWPVVKGDAWEANDWDWLEMKKNISHDGLFDDLILEFRISTNYHNTSLRSIFVSWLLFLDK